MEPWQRLDSASAADARRLLLTCCGSTRWVERMLARRPFGNMIRLLSASEDCWHALSPDDWKEAFSHHPKIGERDLSRARFAATRHLSEAEQAGVAGAPATVLQDLAHSNRQYEARFGYVFIICATGRSAPEVLANLRSRLTNDPADEIRIAAAEQARITALRLTAMT
ncbi:MAG TPA: 2-oxo-4-hydroxy-4-carboxy-5-ureidoimidazoline decarboxylase [Vicinamibacterales bacterium]|nr:2-oxo-4-hydroxy-4-carboxy-5-ureidoimidazoline decarboxylase [Vicinamibacterales bacterium]